MYRMSVRQGLAAYNMLDKYKHHLPDDLFDAIYKK
jgi:hypothetical protein